MFKYKITVRQIINLIGMLLAGSMVIYGLWQISTNTFTRIFMVAFGAFVEILVQYIWGASFAYGRSGHQVKNILLKLACIGYVSVFGLLLTAGFFLSEIGYHESAATVLTNARTERNDEIKQYNKRIDNLLEQAKNEATGKTKGFGNNAKQIETDITNLTNERDILKNSPLKFERNKADDVRNVFKALSDTTTIPENWLKFIVFGYAMFMIYLGVMLTYWKVNIVNETSETIGNKGFETGQETAKSSNETECACGCGRTFQTSPGRKYYDDNCRLRAFRNRKEAAGE